MANIFTAYKYAFVPVSAYIYVCVFLNLFLPLL